MDGVVGIEGGGRASAAAGRSRPRGARPAAQLIVVAASLGASALLLCALLGYGLAHATDERAVMRQRAALQAELRNRSTDEFDSNLVRAIAQRSGLKGLTFGAEPAGRNRATQPVMNGTGRIVGFFSWDRSRQMTDMMDRFSPLIGGLMAALMGFAGFSVWQLRTLRGKSADDTAQPIPSRPAASLLTDDEQFIRRELPQALASGELYLHYQPIVSAQGANMVGVEALLRWTHPHRGAIGPAVFIPIAEKIGLIDQVGAFVLRRALEQARLWPSLYMAVNLSPLQVRDRSIIDLVHSALAQTGVEAARLMLEITEGVLIDNPDEMLERIADLHDLGVRIALDDFGSGYSSLGYLQRFPIDKLKIDRSFVTALAQESNGGVIVQAITALGRALGISVLAEGVETEEQRILLRLAGCSEMQGYLFGRPGPAFTIDRLLAQSEAAGTTGAPPGFSRALTA